MYVSVSQVVAKVNAVYPKDPEFPELGVDDMTKLAYLHEPGLLLNLKCRYDSNEIYVSYTTFGYIYQFSNQFFLACKVLCCLHLPSRDLQRNIISFNDVWSQTYTGNILIAVNPFKRLPHLYGTDTMKQYKGTPFGELSPHPFAVADSAYRYHCISFFYFFFSLSLAFSSLHSSPKIYKHLGK